MNRAKVKDIVRDIAYQGTLILYREAVRLLKNGQVEEAQTIIRDADELRKRVKLRKPIILRRMVCKNCGTPLVPGLTATYRLRRDGSITKLVVTCTVCGYKRRFILRRRRGKREGKIEEAKGAGSATKSRRNNRKERFK